MILTAHQPAFMPWLGYFNKIRKSDVFVYLDTVQFERNSFINRNKIKTPQGPIWLTIPVMLKDHFNKRINEIEIDNRQNWKEKQLKSIYFNYKKSLYFNKNYPKLEMLYSKKYDKLNELCYDQLLFWIKEAGIRTQIIKQSELKIDSKKSDLILDICLQLHADIYISGVLGSDYLEEVKFVNSNIKVEYQSFEHPIYNQLYGEFLPNLSILDLWMNAGLKIIE